MLPMPATTRRRQRQREHYCCARIGACVLQTCSNREQPEQQLKKRYVGWLVGIGNNNNNNNSGKPITDLLSIINGSIDIGIVRCYHVATFNAHKFKSLCKTSAHKMQNYNNNHNNNSKRNSNMESNSVNLKITQQLLSHSYDFAFCSASASSSSCSHCCCSSSPLNRWLLLPKGAGACVRGWGSGKVMPAHIILFVSVVALRCCCSCACVSCSFLCISIAAYTYLKFNCLDI